MEERIIFMHKDFKYYISKYFKEYLPLTLGVSKNSIRSYKTTFLLLFEYLRNIKKININLIDFEDINFETKGINCHRCSNNCEIICVSRDKKIIDAWGNRCEKGEIRVNS